MLNHELRPLLQSDEPLHELLREAYDVDFSSAKLLKDNFNFVFATEKLILRFSPARKKSLQEISAELSWTQHLNQQHLSVNQIVTAKSGEPYLKVTVAGEELYLVVFVRSKGTPITMADWDEGLFSKLGALTGQLHQASLAFQPQIDHNFPHWHQQSKCACLAALPEDERRLPFILGQLNHQLAAQPQLPSHYGVIHYDIHQGNYFLLKELPDTPLFLFDFEMTCLGSYLQDIAVILYYANNFNWAHKKQSQKEFEQYFLQVFGAAYHKFMPGVALEMEVIQAHLLYRDLFVYSYVIDAWKGRDLSAGDLRLINQLEQNITRRSKAQGFA